MTPDYAKNTFERYDEYHHSDKTLNDYRTPDDKLTEYERPAMSTQELKEFLHEKEQDIALDTYPF